MVEEEQGAGKVLNLLVMNQTDKIVIKGYINNDITQDTYMFQFEEN